MKQLTIFISIILFVYLNIFISSGAIFSNLNLFNNINIVQILTPLVQILLAFGLAYFVNIKLAKQTKSIEIIIDMLNNYANALKDINELSIKYIKDKSENDAKEILWKLKQASISHQQFETIYQLFPNVEFVYNIEIMKNDLLDLKKSITDEHFRSDGEYTALQKTLILNCFQKINTNIYKEKQNLYK